MHVQSNRKEHSNLFCTMTNKCTTIHKLSHFYMFRHYRLILGELVIIPCQVTQVRVFQMQLLVIQFTIKMFHIGFMDVETCRSVKICEIIVHLLIMVQNNKRCTVHEFKKRPFEFLPSFLGVYVALYYSHI
jgi:hypothetical protein